MSGVTIESHTDCWYLMYGSLPDLNGARLRLFASGRAEVFDCDGRTTYFETLESARWWLAEDEFQPLESFDAEDEVECGVKFAEIRPPHAPHEQALLAKMLVRRQER